MSEQRQRFEAETREDPRDLERDIDATREHMERTLDALERKLSPGELIDQLIGAVRRNGGDFTRNLGVQVRNNPVPTVLAGVGLLWLMSASDSAPRPRPVAAGEPGLRDRMRSSAGALGAKAHEAGQRAHEMREHAGSGMRRARGAVRSGGESLRDTYSYLVDQQPLLLGGLGVALGAALGALTPRTDAEDQLFGEWSDRVREQTRAEGSRQYAKARHVAERAAETAREEASHEWSEAPESE